MLILILITVNSPVWLEQRELGEGWEGIGRGDGRARGETGEVGVLEPGNELP